MYLLYYYLPSVTVPSFTSRYANKICPASNLFNFSFQWKIHQNLAITENGNVAIKITPAENSAKGHFNLPNSARRTSSNLFGTIFYVIWERRQEGIIKKIHFCQWNEICGSRFCKTISRNHNYATFSTYDTNFVSTSVKLECETRIIIDTHLNRVLNRNQQEKYNEI